MSSTMRPPQRRGHPARPFVISLLVLLSLVGLSYISHALWANDKVQALQQLSSRRLNAREDDADKCRHVHSAQDQCAFVKKNCEEEESGLFSYLKLYYCTLPHVKPVAFMIIVTWISLLFSTIGIAASDFFCVNLSTISNILGMSESMAGVTFLAFGNGSPDVFSTFAAIKSNSGSLALGELYGAAGFITTVVAGSMALVRPFKVAKRSFVRDVSFFIVATCFSMVFLANGSLTILESGIMVGFYMFYVTIVVIWHWWLNRRRRRREREAAARSHYVLLSGEELATEEEHHNDENETTARAYGSRNVSMDDLDALERVGYQHVDGLDELEEEQVRDKWLGEISSNMRITMPPDGERRRVFNPIRPSLVGALEFRAVLSSLQKSRNLQTMPIHMRRYSDTPVYTPSQQTNGKPISSENEIRRASEDNNNKNNDTEQYSDVRTLDFQNHRLLLKPRSRAVSANEAVGRVEFDSSQFERIIPQIDVLSASPPTMDEQEGLDTIGAAKFSDNSLASVTSATKVSPVVEQAPQTTSESTAQDMLAPLPSPLEQADELQGGKRAVYRQSQPSGPKHRHRRSTVVRPRLELSLPGSSSLSTPDQLVSRPLLSLHRDNSYTSIAVSSVPSLILPQPAGSDASDDFEEENNYKPPGWWPTRYLPVPPVIARTLFPTIYGWREKTIWEKLLGIAAAPSFFLLTLTLPIVDPLRDTETNVSVKPRPGSSDKPNSPHSATKLPTASAIGAQDYGSTARIAVMAENEHAIQDELEAEETWHVPERAAEPTATPKTWNRWLALIHCVTSPIFLILIVWTNTSAPAKTLVKPILFSLTGSLLTILLLLLTTTPHHPPKWHFLLCFVGFAVSVCWISTIAEEVVAVLKTIGVIFNISDAILGLTIFAVGNSLGDFVADVTVARLGYPVMALSACFGGPMLNILLGIGLSGLYMTIRGAERHEHKHPGKRLKFKPYHVDVSATLLISGSALLVTLVGLLIVVPLNKWRMDRKIGCGLVILWVASTVVNVVVEITGVLDGSP